MAKFQPERAYLRLYYLGFYTISMKKLIVLIFLFAGALHAQDLTNPKAFFEEMEQVRTQEMQSFRRMSPGEMQNAAGFSVATSNFDIHYIRPNWYIDPAVFQISGNVHLGFTITQSTNTITFDLLNQLVVDSVLYHGSSISFQRSTADALIINFPSTVNTGTKDSLSIFYRGAPGGGGFGTFFKGTHAGVPVVYTLSEPYGSREWWPCKNNLLDKADSIDIIISCPQEYRSSSNGLIGSNTVNGPTRTTIFKHRYPIATYLVAVAVTNYSESNDTVQVGNRVITLQNFFYPETGNFSAYLRFHRSAFRTFTQWFGEYPFANEKYGITQWGWGGGMEHQTNSFQVNPNPNLSAHELAHQWFGDKITCGSWQDIWLNEGFATYLTLMFLEFGFPNSYGPNFVGTYNNVLLDSSGSVFCRDTTDVGRIFSSRLSYNKGAMVLHMLRKVVGDSTFARGVRRYLSDPKLSYGYALTADLQRNIEAEYGKSLDNFFQKWVYGEGYPNYQASWKQNKNNWVTVKLNQTTSHPSVKFYDMPVTLLLRGASQGKSYTVEHTFSGQEFSFDPGFAIDTVIIDPELNILSKIKTSTKQASSGVSNEIKIYPNPSSNGPVYISLLNPTDRNLYLRLYNNLGQLIWQQDLITVGNDELISIPSDRLARGIYHLQLRSEKSIKMVKKIVR